MAKKYLLYIHDPRFDAESHKSGLINTLLAKHYLVSGSSTVEPLAVNEEVAGSSPAQTAKISSREPARAERERQERDQIRRRMSGN